MATQSRISIGSSNTALTTPVTVTVGIGAPAANSQCFYLDYLYVTVTVALTASQTIGIFVDGVMIGWMDSTTPSNFTLQSFAKPIPVGSSITIVITGGGAGTPITAHYGAQGDLI